MEYENASDQTPTSLNLEIDYMNHCLWMTGADLGVGEGGQPPTLSLLLPTLIPTHQFSLNEDIQ